MVAPEPIMQPPINTPHTWRLEPILHRIHTLERRINILSAVLAAHQREHDHWTDVMTKLGNRWMGQLDDLYELRNEMERANS